LFQEVQGCDPFVHKKDCTGKNGIHPLFRFVACLHHFANGDAFDCEDKYLQLLELALSESVKAFAKLIVEKFGNQYLSRTPNHDEACYLFWWMSKCGFPRVLGGWDCKHFDWKNCPPGNFSINIR